MIDVCLLGTGGMLPLPRRRLSTTLVRFGSDLVLIDCGEGTQVALRERGWGLRHLKAILLTHMHADHVLGVPGLLLTLANSGKGPADPLTIYGPEPLPQILQGLLVVAPRLPYPLKLVVLNGGESVPLAYVEGMAVSCVRLEHDVPCLAYALAVSRSPRFNPDRARALGLPLHAWHRLQTGQSVEVEGRVVAPAAVLGPPRRGLRLVVATDTCSTPELTSFVRGTGEGVDLLIADAMYGDEENKPSRWEAQHMTFAEAATLARDGGARRLWLTHFSPSVADPAAYLDRATSIFPRTIAGHDGLTATLSFADDE